MSIVAKVVVSQLEAMVLIDAIGLLSRHADSLPSNTLDSGESIRAKLSLAIRHMNLFELNFDSTEMSPIEFDVILDDIPSGVDPNQVGWEGEVECMADGSFGDKTSPITVYPVLPARPTESE